MNLILFFSHSLNDEQISDAKLNLKVDKFINLPPNLQTLFSNVPPELDDLSEFATPFLDFLNKTAQNGDYALIQGDFGLSYILINHSFKKGIIPLYATTKRDVKTDQNGVKTSIFKHIKFRKYTKS